MLPQRLTLDGKAFDVRGLAELADRILVPQPLTPSAAAEHSTLESNKKPPPGGCRTGASASFNHSFKLPIRARSRANGSGRKMFAATFIKMSFVPRRIPYTYTAPEPVPDLLRRDLARRTFRICSLCESCPA
jgi:hypothetical protein